MAEALDIEDLKIYFYDSMLTSEQFEADVGGTGYITPKATEIKMSAGVTSGSFAWLNYAGPYFNPLYSEIILKMKLNSKENVFAFWGFKETLADPTLNMTESHAGFMISGSKLYVSSADGYTQQRVEILAIDPTLMYEYKIKYNEFWYKSLPQIETYLGLPSIRRVERIWTLLQRNTNYAPENMTHYIVLFVSNLTITEKFLLLNRIVYKEEYAD